MPNHRHASFPYPLIAATSLLILFVFFLLSLSPKARENLRKIKTAQKSIDYAKIKVPEPNATSADKDTAVPQSVMESAPGTGSKLRTFTITAQNNRLSKDKIIVYHGDIVHIQFSASDDDKYDLAIPAFGLRQEARKGESKIIEFQAVSPGSFSFTCSKCKTKGTLVVVPKT